METQLEQSRELHWDYGDDPKAKEIFENYYKDRHKEKDLEKRIPRSKVKTTEPNIYCNDCKRNHWGSCRYIVCDKTGHDEENCPTFRYALHLSEPDEKKGTRKEARTSKGKDMDEYLYCKICKEWGKHTTIDCPAQDKERKIKKEKRDREPYCQHCKQWGNVSEPYCGTCKEHNHSSLDCELKKEKERIEKEEPFCYLYNEPGHYAEPFCKFCQNHDHDFEHCTIRLEKLAKRFCTYCKARGQHDVTECPYKDRVEARLRELEIERNDRLESEIDERVNRLRNIDKQLRRNKERKERIEEPTEDDNQWPEPPGGEESRQSNRTYKEKKSEEGRKSQPPRDTREEPIRSMGNGGDDPDPSDNGDDEPTDESDDDEEEEEIEEEEEDEEEEQPPPPPTPEEEAVESFTSSMTSMWDILGNKVSR